MRNFKGVKWSITEGYDDRYEQPIISISDETNFVESLCTVWSGKNIGEEIPKQVKAEALLISKAPEMLDMLERCKEVFDKLNQPFISSDIEELIKSATGI